MERRDIIVAATVSCIFGLNPVSVRDMVYTFRRALLQPKAILGPLVRMQYERNDAILKRGAFASKAILPRSSLLPGECGAHQRRLGRA